MTPGEYLLDVDAGPVEANAGRRTARVVVKNAGVNNARITASRVDGVTFQAVNPVPPGTDYIFAGLSPGNYLSRRSAYMNHVPQ